MFKTICKQASVFLLMFSLLTVVYTGVSTVISQVLFHEQTNGSLIMTNGRIVGSRLIGQDTTNPKLFIGRPMTVTNLNPVSDAEQAAVAKRVAWVQKLDPNNHLAIPADLVTGSAGGTDPYISVAGAQYQRQRIAVRNHLTVADVNKLITAHTTSRLANLFGEPAVNVMTLNAALQQLVTQSH